MTTQEDPLTMLSRFLTKAKTAWMQLTYPFVSFGRGVSIHYSCDIRRPTSKWLRIGDAVYLAPAVWLNVPEPPAAATAAIILDNGCRIGRRCVLSAKNMVHLEADVMVAPSVLITDHSHQFSDVTLPIHSQGTTAGGTVRVEQNCWIGHGAAIVCASGDLVLGRNSVVGANAVVTRSVPPFSIVVGNPARVIKRYDHEVKEWVRTP